MKKKYLVLLLIPLLIAFAGCGKKRHYVAPLPGLEAPSNLTATAISYKQVNLSWQDNSDIEDGFRVCCDMGGNQYQTVDTLPPNTTSFEHYNLQPMTKYTYYIQAYRGNKYANSKEVSATTSCPIEILYRELIRFGHSKVQVRGEVKSHASEACQAEITAYFYDMHTGEPTGGVREDWVELGPFDRTYFVIEYIEPPAIDCDCTLEVTQVKIY